MQNTQTLLTIALIAGIFGMLVAGFTQKLTQHRDRSALLTTKLEEFLNLNQEMIAIRLQIIRLISGSTNLAPETKNLKFDLENKLFLLIFKGTTHVTLYCPRLFTTWKTVLVSNNDSDPVEKVEVVLNSAVTLEKHIERLEIQVTAFLKMLAVTEGNLDRMTEQSFLGGQYRLSGFDRDTVTFWKRSFDIK